MLFKKRRFFAVQVLKINAQKERMRFQVLNIVDPKTFCRIFNEQIFYQVLSNVWTVIWHLIFAIFYILECRFLAILAKWRWVVFRKNLPDNDSKTPKITSERCLRLSRTFFNCFRTNVFFSSYNFFFVVLFYEERVFWLK